MGTMRTVCVVAACVWGVVYKTPIYGGINDYAYYFVDVLVGSQGSRVSVILDSGSSLFGFPCKSCRLCGRHLDVPYDPNSSATNEAWGCHDPRCVAHGGAFGQACTPLRQCRYTQVYSEGSSIEGFFFSDLVSLAPYPTPSRPILSTNPLPSPLLSLGSSSSSQAGPPPSALLANSGSAGVPLPSITLIPHGPSSPAGSTASPAGGTPSSLFPPPEKSSSLNVSPLNVSSSASPTGGGSTANPAVRFDYIGCHTKETVLFTSQAANGILGVSFPREGKQPTVMDALLNNPELDAKRFAMCTSEDGGVLTIGGFDENLILPSYSRRNGLYTGTVLARFVRGTGRQPVVVEELSREVVWAPIVSNKSYTLKVSGLSIHDKRKGSFDKVADRGFGEVLVDSGTTYTYFPSEVFNKITAALHQLCDSHNKQSSPGSYCSRSRQDIICFDFSPGGDSEQSIRQNLSQISSFSLELADGGVIEWTPNSWLFRKSPKIWCAAFENNRRAQTILGMSFLKEKQVIFDRENMTIGFAVAQCPSFSQRLTTSSVNPPLSSDRVFPSPNLRLPLNWRDANNFTSGEVVLIWFFGIVIGFGLIGVVSRSVSYSSHPDYNRFSAS